jgi:hypothetical protein
MEAKRFVEAVKRLNWVEVLDDEDLRRVHSLYAEAAERSAGHVLVGFRVPGPVVRIVWVVVELIPLGLLTGEDLAPDLPPGDWEGYDFRLDRLTFAQGPTAELAELDDAKPDGLEGSQAILLAYPGPVSWDELRQTAERLLQ